MPATKPTQRIRTNRQTKTQVLVPLVKPDSGWFVECVTHGKRKPVKDMKQSHVAARSPQDFCKACKDRARRQGLPTSTGILAR